MLSLNMSRLLKVIRASNFDEQSILENELVFLVPSVIVVDTCKPHSLKGIISALANYGPANLSEQGVGQSRARLLPLPLISSSENV